MTLTDEEIIEAAERAKQVHDRIKGRAASRVPEFRPLGAGQFDPKTVSLDAISTAILTERSLTR